MKPRARSTRPRTPGFASCRRQDHRLLHELRHRPDRRRLLGEVGRRRHLRPPLPRRPVAAAEICRFRRHGQSRLLQLHRGARQGPYPRFRRARRPIGSSGRRNPAREEARPLFRRGWARRRGRGVPVPRPGTRRRIVAGDPFNFMQIREKTPPATPGRSARMRWICADRADRAWRSRASSYERPLDGTIAAPAISMRGSLCCSRARLLHERTVWSQAVRRSGGAPGSRSVEAGGRVARASDRPRRGDGLGEVLRVRRPSLHRRPRARAIPTGSEGGLPIRASP